MSEEKKSRTVQEIQQEYQSLCVKAGHTQYQIDAMSKDLSLLNSTMRDLNFEAAGVQAKASADTKAAAEAKAETAPTLEGEASVA